LFLKKQNLCTVWLPSKVVLSAKHAGLLIAADASLEPAPA